MALASGDVLALSGIDIDGLRQRRPDRDARRAAQPDQDHVAGREDRPDLQVSAKSDVEAERIRGFRTSLTSDENRR